MINLINQYRENNNRPQVTIDGQLNEFCTQHCWAMAQEGTIYHAPECYLNDCSEIVVNCWQFQNWGEVERCLIGLIDKSERHRELLLNADIIGYGIVAYKGMVYLTIRGRNG